jgi:hypothetical protein
MPDLTVGFTRIFVGFIYLGRRYVSICEFLHTGSPGKGAKTGILNAIVSHEIPAVEFDFATISVTVCDGEGTF